jgi:hypothetical protein
MYKKITLVLAMATVMSSAFAQSAQKNTYAVTGTGTDTLLYQSFDYTNWTPMYRTTMPAGLSSDTAWYNYDNAMLIDGSGNTTPRPGNWFPVQPFYWGDTTVQKVALGSNSWFSPAGTADDWLITPSIFLSDTTGKFTWKSAVAQTPRYGDGYQIRISSTTNDIGSAFKDTAFTAGEFTGFLTPNNDSAKYQYYSYSPGYVQGMNPADVACKAPLPTRCDSAYMVGILTPHTVSLAKYHGKSIFIAVHHNSHDDNLISVDDLLVTGTGVAGINEYKQQLAISIFPNPTSDNLQVSYNLPTSTSVLVNMYDVTGKLVKSESKGLQYVGQQTININVSDLARGTYTLVLRTAVGKSVAKVIVK